jgi:valyl-tRNA synthetase
MNELPKSYEAQTIEAKWIQFWEERDFFKPNPHNPKGPYCIVMPPPNVTGVLHIGHALVNTLQDILIRWHRMLGYETLWIPGTDHAGIATQTVVERHLMKTQGKRRRDYNREDFLTHVWAWKEENEHHIINQLKRLGCSCDWSRKRFTMDEGNNRAVRTTFKMLYDQNLIYLGDYLVNWDPVTQTAIADEEVEYEDRQSFLWHFKYPLRDGSGFVRIATTRPETMLGDTAVAVAPQDPRYASLVGKTVLLPLMDREIPIIADRLVDPQFGTGMVKVTPAHDPNDYQMGLTHQLPFISIMTPDGKINEHGGKFQGLTMEEARLAVVEAMKALGYLEKVEPHTNRVGVSYRSKATIEPYMSKQWFVRMDGFAKKMKAAVAEGRTTFIPKNWENTYNYWIDNLRDWCISRQLWWGHRIPIWYHVNDPEKIICYDGEGTPSEVQKAPEEWRQDEDVLDTWFSSALWPFSTLGWPEKTLDLTQFYPNSVLVTAHDILFFWVARMILMGEYAMDEVPFPETFIHGLVYGKSYWRSNVSGGITYVPEKERLEYELGKPLPKDVQCKWEKMSKSKGNIIDPLQVIDQYGTDALRMALCASSPQSREIDLDLRRLEEFKNFANKIWNGARFVFLNLEGDSPLSADEFSQGLEEKALLLEDRWILSVVNRTIKEVNGKLGAYLFDQAALQAYDFFWKEFCSYYLEISKPLLFGKVGTPVERKNKQKILAIVLCAAMRLIHPMAPFITEELFQLLKERLKGASINPEADPYTVEAINALQASACIVAHYPQIIRESDLNPEINEAFELVGNVVYMIRNIRGEVKLPPSAATDVYIIGKENDPNFLKVQQNCNIITALVRTNKIEFHTTEPEAGFCSMGVSGTLKIMIPVPEEFLKQEKVRLEKELEKLSGSLDRLRKQLSNQEFVKNAPPELIEKQKNSLEQAEAEIGQITAKLSQWQ